MKYLHLVVGALFFTMAAIQLNDPDPLYWVAVYLAVAGVAGLRFMSAASQLLPRIVLGMVIAGLLMSAPGFVEYLSTDDLLPIYGPMMEDKPYIESTREFGGLFIAIVYLLLFEVSAEAEEAA